MRYAVISDIHANYQALKAVLTDIRSNEIDEIICLGDIIGYGPSPEKTLELAYKSIHYFVLGNHDAVLTNFLSPDNFNEEAKKILEWTRKRLSDEVVEFFKTFPLILDSEIFMCVHSNVVRPECFDYIFDSDSALQNFNVSCRQIVFIGHTHVPGIFVRGRSGAAHWLNPIDFGIEEHKRYIVNVGSVGQPRNGDIRASYSVIDTSLKNVFFRFIPFDIDAYKEEINKNRIDASAKISYFLFSHQKGPTPPLREQIQFTPLSHQHNSKRKNTPVKIRKLEETVSRLKSSQKKYKIIISLLIVILVILLTFYTKFHTNSNQSIHCLIPAQKSKIISPEIFSKKKNLLFPPSHLGEVNKKNRLYYWSLKYSCPNSQKIYISYDDSEYSKRKPTKKQIINSTVVTIQSHKETEITFFHTGIKIPRKTRLRASLQYKATIKSGYFEIVLKERKKNKREKILVRSRSVTDSYKNRWKILSVTIPKGREVEKGAVIFFLVHGEFFGEIKLRKLKLIPKL